MVKIQIDLPNTLNKLVEIENAKQGNKDKRKTIINLLNKVLK